MALTARERQIMAGGAASAASEATGASYRPPGQSIRPIIQPKIPVLMVQGTGPGGVKLVNGELPPIAMGGANPLLMAAPAIIAGAGALIDRFAFPQQGLFQQEQQSQPVVPGAPYGVPFGGPGLAEPGKPYLLREWHIRFDSKDGDFECQYYLTMTPSGRRRIFMYNQRTKAWKSWVPARLAVIGKNMPSHRMVTRLRHMLSRQSKDCKTILKLVSPNSLAKPKHHYHYRGRR